MATANAYDRMVTGDREESLEHGSNGRRTTPRRVLGGAGVSAAALALLMPLLMSCDAQDASGWSLVPGRRVGIVGGEETGYAVHRGAVGIFVSLGEYGSIGTGTLIRPDVVLTAGHVVYMPRDGSNMVETPEKLQVFGGPDYYDKETRIDYPGVDSVTIHPTWTGDVYDMENIDLALLRLERPIEEVETYTAVDPQAPVAIGDSGRIVGYGLADAVDIETIGVHRLGESEVLSREIHRFETGGESNVCGGDSGGPFFVEREGVWFLAGVTTFSTNPLCPIDSGAWFIDASEYAEWIEQTADELSRWEPPVDAGTEPTPDAGGEEDAGLTSDETANNGSGGCGVTPAQRPASPLTKLGRLL
jgi:V8-like Glu-specific endopeptidase